MPTDFCSRCNKLKELWNNTRQCERCYLYTREYQAKHKKPPKFTEKQKLDNLIVQYKIDHAKDWDELFSAAREINSCAESHRPGLWDRYVEKVRVWHPWERTYGKETYL